jgi:signal transduction histidine kinase
MKFLRQLSLPRKILLGILPLFLLFVTISVVLQNYFLEKEMVREARGVAITYANIIKESMVSMMVNDLRIDSTFLHRVNNLSRLDTVSIVLNDLRLRKEVLLRERVPAGERPGHSAVPDQVVKSVFNEGIAVFHREGHTFRAVVPFQATGVCQKCHSVPAGYVLGAADLRISLANLAEASMDNWQRSILIFLLSSIAIFAAGSLMFTWFVGRPIERLVQATTEIGSGHLDAQLPMQNRNGTRETGSKDELDFLAVKFEQMRVSLKEKIRQLDRANADLSSRNAEVEQTLTRLRETQNELLRVERVAGIGRMTAQLSHEINNPIHNIQSLLESSLRKVSGHPEVRELIEVALEEVSRVSKLTRQMLSFSRGESFEVRKDLVEADDLLHDVGLVYRQQLAAKSIDLRFEVERGLPPIVASKDRLKEVFHNLIENARDAIVPPGKITVSVSRNTSHLVFRVSDTGRGIPPDNLERIFDPFFTTKGEVSGVGLGLFVSHGIVQQHGGAMHVASRINEGTTFTIEIPLVRIHHQEQVGHHEL